MRVAQEEELVVAESDSRQLRLLRTTSARVDPAPVRLLTNTLSSEHISAALMLTRQHKGSSGRGNCYISSKLRPADVLYSLKLY